MTKEKVVDLSRSELLKLIDKAIVIDGGELSLLSAPAEPFAVHWELEIPEGLNRSQMKKLIKGDGE